jgi:predicted phosphatase
MVEYTPDEVKMLIQILKNIKTRKKGEKEKIEKTIRYLDQRHKFFNPTRDMLIYIIDCGEKFGLNPALLSKMKEDLVVKG